MEAVGILAVIFTGAFFIVVASLFLAYKMRAIDHKERLAAIEKGIPLPDLAKGSSCCDGRHRSLQRGITLLFIGAGLSLALYVTAGLNVAVWGVFVAFVGMGHIVWWVIAGRLGDGSANGSGS